jgi:hypothetical protein
MDNENKELLEILKNEDDCVKVKGIAEPDCCEEAAQSFGKSFPTSLVQWTTGDGKTYFPAGKTTKLLSPGVYEIGHCERGLFFQRIPVRTEGLIHFPQTNMEGVVEEIQTFWSREDKFIEYSLTYKRGIILWGPAGSGKSCTVQLIVRDVIERGGVVIKFTQPALFMQGMRDLREIQKDTPVVVLMEDIDSILDHYSESSVLNILDGVDEVSKVVFLATTNYPERLGARIINRPSRFDKRFKIGHPNAESRRIYFEYIIGGQEKAEQLKIDLDRWVKDTKGFSIAHLKELFVAVCILGDNYEDAIETLESMKECVVSDKEFDSPPMGFERRPLKRKTNFS